MGVVINAATLPKYEYAQSLGSKVNKNHDIHELAVSYVIYNQSEELSLPPPHTPKQFIIIHNLIVELFTQDIHFLPRAH